MRAPRPPRHGVVMTQAVPERPLLRGRRPWSNRTSPRSDIVAAVVLFLVEAAVLVWATLDYVLSTWVAQDNQDEIDAADLANIAWMEHFLYVVLALAVLSALSRAPWTLVSHLLTAFVVTMLFTGAQHDYEVGHPDPAATPTVRYAPCLSGSGKCH